MPVRNVSRFFNLEQQRQEINRIAVDIGDIDTLSAGETTNLVSAINATYAALVSAEAGVIGVPTDGSYLNGSYAVYLDSNTSVADAVDKINNIVGKILPEKPQSISNFSIDLSSYSLSRYCSGVTGLDNGLVSVPGAGSTIKVTRSIAYTTNTLSNVGPSDSGTLQVLRNNSSVGSVTFTSADDTGTYNDLVILSDVDYSQIVNIPANIWYSYDTYATGNSSVGWNSLFFTQDGSNSGSVQWFYDTANPGSPILSSSITEPLTSDLNYSSGIPHFTASNNFNLTLTFGKLSGNVFPVTNEFITSTPNLLFSQPTSITYGDVGISLPLPVNYLSSSTFVYDVTLPIRDTHLSSSTFPTFTISNSYATTNHTPSYSKTILVKGDTASSTKVDEQNIVISSLGDGGNGVRVSSGSNSDTPSNIWNATPVNFNSAITLSSFESTVVGGVLKHDQTNYSVNYAPTGPNLSSGRSGSQYFTFKFTRSSVSNFGIALTSSTGIAGLWITSNIATLISNNTSTNGWVTPTLLYAGIGVPVGGCAIESTLPLNTALNNTVVNCTFGSESSSNSPSGDIFVRIKLSSGQSVSLVSISNSLV